MIQDPASTLVGKNYQERLALEKDIYHDDDDVHDLPDIFHYWSNTHIRPKVAALGFDGATDMFEKCLAEQCERRTTVAQRFLSIGCGNCDLEIELASKLRARGHTNFVIDCLDLNPAMLERGLIAAERAEMSDRISPLEADFNVWKPAHEYDAAIANHALHHVLNLEGLFSGIKASLKPRGTFAIADIAGRNGHRRWPEALAIVHEFWRKLPPSYRFNRQLNRYEELLEDWDTSRESFEGIRAQDILPLLVSEFHFQFFAGFGNVIDPFVDRSFGPNFNAGDVWDRAFIDEVHRRDEEELTAGRIKPTHIFAIVGNDPNAPIKCQPPMTPKFCVRPPDAQVESLKTDSSSSAYDWQAWPHNPQRELEIVCEMLKSSEDRIRRAVAWAHELEKDCRERTEWAQRLDRELAERTAWALKLKAEVEEHKAYIRGLSP